ncbi:polysaccharide biosynthesis protein [Rhodoferax mekongensis]|uniref:Nucleoside-diphosphate sugar epimerase/dehydratase n=1 Tax=Rhodoferax mekongensis TaxID=3068341 RepID=A0ABZ0B311_9BURK|nr:nucleoside-diphosphate sugar epimerase/dehydratase [Rhodoferax sp. TBRC 17307]WNO05838.1 nucleoside-diphosphate sugar epimerase/dehydratase [Rhodoferax sp. TBRC 17307]
MHSKLLAWPRSAKRLIVIALDVVLAILSTWIAYSLRLEGLHRPAEAQWWVYGIAPVLAIPIFIRFGLYRAIFRYTGQAALIATGKAVALYALFLSALLMWHQWPMVPRSLGLLQPMVFLVLVGASRAFARFWLAEMDAKARGSSGRLLIYGAGNAGAQTAAALGVARQYDLVGFVDDDETMAGRSLNGLPVYSAKALSRLVSSEAITDILLAMPNAPRERRNQIIAALDGIPVHVRTLPSMSDLASGKVTVQDIRELDIEDLLGRDPVPPSEALLNRELNGKVVLVSGAGGSIGSELARQICAQLPANLILLDHNEFGLYSTHQELSTMHSEHGVSVELVPLLGSVSNEERLRDVLTTHRPSVVYHAAAYKHVPMVEDNPGEGVRNNIFGTLNLARAAAQAGVKRFVLISTDKAVRPTNVMGATKRVAELVLQALAANNPETCFSMVRFGNVLGSSGSVVPLFRKQLAEGGPLTVTHEEVTRYFMTIPEAAQLVLQAGAMGQGGDVFVLDMGKPVKIMDLARRMIQLSGLSVRDAAHPDGDIEIAVTGLRTGEKLYEELLIGDNPQPTEHPRIMKAHEPYVPWEQLKPELDALYVAAERNDMFAIKAFMQKHVQGYQPA